MLQIKHPETPRHPGQEEDKTAYGRGESATPGSKIHRDEPPAPDKKGLMKTGDETVSYPEGRTSEEEKPQEMRIG